MQNSTTVQFRQKKSKRGKHGFIGIAPETTFDGALIVADKGLVVYQDKDGNAIEEENEEFIGLILPRLNSHEWCAK